MRFAAASKTDPFVTDSGRHFEGLTKVGAGGPPFKGPKWAPLNSANCTPEGDPTFEGAEVCQNCPTLERCAWTLEQWPTHK